MARPKGSKNKKTVIMETGDKKFAAVQAEIDELTKALKAKRSELKALTKARIECEKRAAAKKAEEDKATLLAALEQSGKSFDEIMEMLKR